jgi:energy-coupling factor transporter ATP-binding protein EcfA2
VLIPETGAGKSTLIKLLVSHMEHKLPFISASPFRSPVVGSAKNDKSPTSGDVHLYADPATAFGPLPMLYADCEGLEGGEVPPVATRSRALGKSSMKQQLRRNLFRGKSRTLAWAVSAETSGREFAVRHLYPRLLYTFSDVIVFVLRNPRYNLSPVFPSEFYL